MIVKGSSARSLSGHSYERGITVVLLGLVAGRRTGLMTTADAARETAAAKIRRVLPERLARRLDAVRHRRPISIRYTAGDGRCGSRGRSSLPTRGLRA